MIGTVGLPQIIIIALVIILLFGAGKVSRMGRELGASVREFRRSVSEEDEGGSAQVTQVDPAPPVQQQPPYVSAPPPQREEAPASRDGRDVF